MRKTFAAAAVGAGAAMGGIAGAVTGTPGVAAAAESATTTAGWVQDALRGLVDDSTITREQADAVESALDGARPGPGAGHRGPGGVRMGLATAAEAIGVGEDDLLAALREGRTIADVAADEGVETRAVVDAIVAAHRERLEQRVADGRLSREHADRMLTGTEGRVAAMVEGDRPAFHGGHGGPGRHGGMGEMGEAGRRGPAGDPPGSGARVERRGGPA